jgi:Rieske Fe-S protein
MVDAKAASSSNAINRREFLNYLLAASGAALAAGTCGAANWLTIPHRPLSPQGGLFVFTPPQIPSIEEVPKFYLNEPIVANVSANFWLSNTEQGLLALNQACTFRGCLVRWKPDGSNVYRFPHFFCPCCASQFAKGGVYLAGPAPRNLDQFRIEVTTPNGVHSTPASGGPVDIRGATQIVVDVEKKILGKPRSTFTLLQ